MFRFISTLKRDTLNARYLDIFGTVKSKEKKFSKLLEDYPPICDVIPQKYQSFKAILIAPFDILAHIYFDYCTYVDTLSNSTDIHDKLSLIFNYSSYSTKIGHFLVNPINGFPIHNCNYCDIHRVVGYTEEDSGNRVREFETEHILDKGQCPIVALSLYNFVPSCGTCNDQHHKGSRTLGRTVEETILLSPTMTNNRFAEEVSFTIFPLNDDIKDLRMFESDDDLVIDFKGKSEKYNSTIDMFSLKDRYNARKSNIFEVIERMRSWSIDFDRNLMFETLEDAVIFERFFQFKRRAESFEPMEKCRRDIFENHFGKIPD